MQRWMCVVFLLLCSAALTGQEVPIPATWMHPSDQQLSAAVDAGYSTKKPAKNEQYHQIRNWLKPGIDARMEIIPPIVCALHMGETAYQKLEEKPSIEAVKLACSDSISVIFVHYSQSLKANWPCVIESDGKRLEPALKVLDDNPQVVTYWPGGLSDNVAGYRYMDAYVFRVTEEWSKSAKLTFANDIGTHQSFNLDFSIFAKDLARH
jgi:hypothetical protein